MRFFRKWFSQIHHETDQDLERHERLEWREQTGAIYAIGDVHGEFDLLQKLEAHILRHAEKFEQQSRIVLLGDLVDRGAQSAQVIEHLLNQPLPGCERYILLGNHDYYMLCAYHGRPNSQRWLDYGGKDTLMSYYGGSLPDKYVGRATKPADLSEFMSAIIPKDHIEFLEKLPISIETPSYFFVHAGIRPTIPFKQQNAHDLITIREGFIDVPCQCEKIIVHGHTIVSIDNVVLDDRVSLDTGAYTTKTLTAACFQPNVPPDILTARQ